MKRAHTIPLSKHAFPRGARAAVVAQRWRPLTLTWRKSLHARERRAGRSSARISRNTWSPRFQLHVNLAFGAAFTKRVELAMFSPSPIFWSTSHTHRTSVEMAARSLFASETRRLTHRLLRHAAARERTIRSWTSLETRGAFFASTFSAETKRIFRSRTLPSNFVGPSSHQGSVRGAKRSTCQTSDPVHWIRHSHAKFRTSHAVRSNASREPAQLAFARGGTAHARTVRPPELVWRTEPQTFAADAIERSISAATSPVATFVTHSAAHFEPSRATVETVPTRAFDAALMDRLAEDVMGRVERRIRIERERRGV